MKVLQFIPSLNAYDGGTTTYMQQLAPHLGASSELHICVLTSLSECVAIEGATLHNIELSLWHIGRMKRQWMALLDEIRPDVLHVNCCWMPHCALVWHWTKLWSKEQKKRVPYILTPHGMLEPWLVQRNYWTRKVPAMWLYQRRAVSQADAVVATAEIERQHLMDNGWASRDQIALLPNGIDASSIDVKSSWKEGELTLLFMSRLHPKKGLDLLIQALCNVPGFRLLIAGEGDKEYVETLQRQIVESLLVDRCSFLGPIYGVRKWEVIRSADVVVLPSRSENFGLIVAEALASGVPVLTTHGTPWQEVEERDCGWWVDPSVKGLQEALEKIVRTDREQLQKMGERGRRLILERYDIRTLAHRLLGLYERLS